MQINLVEMETEWNLKVVNNDSAFDCYFVEMETEWNLKNEYEHWKERDR